VGPAVRYPVCPVGAAVWHPVCPDGSNILVILLTINYQDLILPCPDIIYHKKYGDTRHRTHGVPYNGSHRTRGMAPILIILLITEN
jgi:hypothetical protein